MITTLKDITEQGIDRFTAGTLKRGLIKSFNKSNYTADILFEGSGQTTVKGVPVSRDIPSRTCRSNARCVVLTVDPTNPQDSMVVVIYSGASGAPNVVNSYNDSQSMNTPANDITTWVTVPSSKIQVQTGPGTVRLRVDGSFYLGKGTGGGSAKTRIKATITDTTLSPLSSAISYFPNSFGRVLFFSGNNIYFPFGYDWSVDVPEGVHQFEVQVRGNSLPTGTSTINLDANGAISISVIEL